MYKYKVSVVMAVYNVEPFIEKAVDSLIKQTIGFENIQLVFVEDSSPDNCAAICDRYAALYPNNVVVLHKENEGVAKARVDGIRLAEGKYISFFDPDDTLSPETFMNMVDFFEEHFEQTDVVAMPLYLTGEKTGPHPLNNKFSKGTRVIDLNEEYDCFQLSLASVLIKKDVAHMIEADSEIVTAEDAKELFKILLLKNTIGVVREARYNYLKRSTSSVGSAQSKKGWYNTYLNNFPQYTFDYCMDRLGYVPKFVQYMVMYDLQWKFRPAHIPLGILTDEEADQYRKHLIALLSYIDDDVIWNQKNLNIEQKIYLVESKNPDMKPVVMPHVYDKNPVYTFHNTVVCGYDRFQIRLNFANVYEDRVEIEGVYLIPTASLGKPELFAIVNGTRILAQDNNYDEVIYSVDTAIALRKGFKVTIPLSEDQFKIGFLLKYETFEVFMHNLVLGKHFPITYRLHHSHYYKNGYMMFPTKTGLRMQKMNLMHARSIEVKYLKELYKRKDKAAKHAFAARLLVHLLRPFAHKNIWLITDKADRADDNGEAFFLHCMKNKKQAGCYPIFAVGKKSPDYKRLRKYGPVIPYMSWRHKLCHLLATHTISAYSHDEIVSPFLDYSYYYSDLLQKNKTIFLQHGITKDDVSNGLNRNHKNFALFVTATRPEYESILTYNYGYTERQVILTGFPRYDRLYDNNRKKITVMPTWRRSLFGSYNPNTSRWSLLPGFEKSDFYRFYSGLLNSPKLFTAAQEYGYSLQFLIHPTLFPYLDHFQLDSRVLILKEDAVYRDVFAESSLILTDYSSVAFDMAYLRKPVLYAHFDTNHYAEGYFDYERDGFGEVEYTLDDTVNRIIEYMENGCQLKDEYRKRIDGFFAFDDKNNCQRVYEKIMELDGGAE